MSTNRRRFANAVPIASFATWALIGIFACGAGLGYVWCKNQLYVTGSEIKKLEVELAQTKRKNEVARVSITKNSSTLKLRERVASGFTGLMPIPPNRPDHPDRIVVVVGTVDAPGATGHNDLRPVSNQTLQE
jgi:hypothetical protein